MIIIRLNNKNLAYIFIFTVVIFIGFKVIETVDYVTLHDILFKDETRGPQCARRMHYFDENQKHPAIGILGSPGSGVEWIRYLIEQLTEVYTGSTQITYPQYFIAEGKTTHVVGVLAHNIEGLKLDAAVVIYRNVRDCIRTEFIKQKGRGLLTDTPIKEFYNKQWGVFATQESRNWVQNYKQYLDSKIPLLIIDYDKFTKPDGLQTQLLKISNFLRQPVSTNTLHCLTKVGSKHPLKPVALKSDFHPFHLLAVHENTMFDKLENETFSRVKHAQDHYKPIIHIGN